MKQSYISNVHLNNFQKYIMKKEHDKHNILNHSLRHHNSPKFTTRPFPLSPKKINQNKTLINEEKKGYESSLINKKLNKQILTPLQKLKHKFLEPKKKLEADSTFEHLTQLKKKFNLNNLVNSLLFRLYADESYKQLLHHRIGNNTNKKEKIDIKIDLRQTQKKGHFYIPIKKNNLLKEKREIGIQSSNSFEDILNNNSINSPNSKENKIKYEQQEINIRNFNENNKNNNINKNNKNNNNNKSNKVNNNNNEKKCYSDRKKKKVPKINNYKLTFNKYNLINKKLVKNFLNYSERKKSNEYTKIKRIISTEREKMGKILDNLRFEQSHDADILKNELAKLEGKGGRKSKKNINNSYNVFI